MFRYTLSKISLVGMILFAVGCFFTVQGILSRSNLSLVKRSYEQSEIKTGRFWECDITREQLMGCYYTEMNGALKYGPYTITDAVTSTQTYLAAVNQDPAYYVPLIVTREYVPSLEEMIDNDGIYHLFGKFEKGTSIFNEILDYDIVIKDTGADSKEAVDQMVSTKFRIKITNLKKEKTVLYKGISLLVIGGAAFAWGIGKEKVVDETAPHRQPWDLT